jgi:hypothetical protein
LKRTSLPLRVPRFTTEVLRMDDISRRRGAARRPVPFAAGKAWCGNMKELRTKRQYKNHQSLQRPGWRR